jgi:hypothetical protein
MTKSLIGCSRCVSRRSTSRRRQDGLGVRKVLASAGQGTPERPVSTAIHLAPSERPAPSPDEKARLCDRPGRRDGGQSHPFLVYALVQLV